MIDRQGVILIIVAVAVTIFGVAFVAITKRSVLDGLLWAVATYIGCGIGLGIVALVRRLIA